MHVYDGMCCARTTEVSKIVLRSALMSNNYDIIQTFREGPLLPYYFGELKKKKTLSA